VKVYNLTTVPVPGTSAVFYTIPLPLNMYTDISYTVPISHSTGLGYTIVAGSADTDATAVAVGEVVGHFVYA
jgi:hypothetical protein